MPDLAVGTAGCTQNAACVTGYCDLSGAGPEIQRCCTGGECCDQDVDCPAGHFCIQAIDGTPEARCSPGGVGLACDDVADCDPGLTCVEAVNRCSDGDDGSWCDGDADCTSGYCDLSSVGPATNRCCAENRIIPNECCVTDGDCPSTLPNCAFNVCSSGDVNARCETDADCDVGNHCVARSNYTCGAGTEGAPCDDASDCDTGLNCSTGTTGTFKCYVPRSTAHGAACGVSDECASNFCNEDASGSVRLCCDTGQTCCARDFQCGTGNQCVPNLNGSPHNGCHTGGSNSPCAVNTDCDANFICLNNVCIAA